MKKVLFAAWFAVVFATKTRIEYDDAVYDGNVNDDGERDGYGVYTWNTDDYVYSGHWSKNQRDGVGTQIYKGVKYEGHFQNGKKHGKGIRTDTNADVFEEEWRYGKRLKQTKMKQVVTKIKDPKKTRSSTQKRFRTPIPKRNEESHREYDLYEPLL